LGKPCLLHKLSTEKCAVLTWHGDFAVALLILSKQNLSNELLSMRRLERWFNAGGKLERIA